MSAPAEDEPADYVVGRLQEALASDPRCNELDVHATVVAGKLYLTGTVATAERREAVAAVAREVAPGYEVHNQTTLYRLSGAGEPEHLA